MNKLWQRMTAKMIENSWNEYRGWAKRSRQLQAELKRSRHATLICAVAASCLGAIAATLGEPLGRGFAAAAAVAAIVSPVVGRHILESGSEKGWILARATAEAIRSECYRAAARLPPFDGAEAVVRLDQRLEALSAGGVKAALTLLPDAVNAGGDARRPPEPMDIDWYVANRIRDQREWYARRQSENERAVRALRLTLLALALLGATMGALATVLKVQWFAPWIAVLTTVGGLVVAHGAMERRQFLAVSYGAMAVALGRLEQRAKLPGTGLAALIDEAERLLGGEHAAWTDNLTQLIASTPADGGGGRQ